MKLTFLGANRQVTGSRYLLEAGGLRMLAIGACAGALTYGVGKLLGVSLA